MACQPEGISKSGGFLLTIWDCLLFNLTAGVPLRVFRIADVGGLTGLA